jgi:hypothetical protein
MSPLPLQLNRSVGRVASQGKSIAIGGREEVIGFAVLESSYHREVNSSGRQPERARPNFAPAVANIFIRDD